MMTSPSFTSFPTGRVIAFAKTWSIESLDADSVRALRERLHSLGAELTVFTDHGIWTCDGDDDGEYRDDIAADLATASALAAARGASDAVFVLDGARAVRVGQSAPTLDAALDAAAELLVTRRLAASTTPAPFASLHRWTEALP